MAGPTPGTAVKAPAAAPAAGTTTSSGPGLAVGGGLLNTARFRWRNLDGEAQFHDRVFFIREVVFGLLGLKLEDLICVQRNHPQRFLDVTLASEEAYQRVLERSKSDHPLLSMYSVEPLWFTDKRVVTVHVFNPYVTVEAVCRFLTKHVEVLPGHRDIRDELGVWNGRRQFQVRLRPDGKGGYLHPPANFSIGPNRGYLFYTGQPTFCRSCQGHGHKAEDCPDLKCRNCLEPGHMAKDCKGPQRCHHCRGEEHLARVCPQRSYAGVLAGGGQVRQGPDREPLPAPKPVGAQEEAARSPVKTPPGTEGPRAQAGQSPPALAGVTKRKKKGDPKDKTKKTRKEAEESTGTPKEAAPPAEAPAQVVLPPTPKTEDISWNLSMLSPALPQEDITFSGLEVSPNDQAYLEDSILGKILGLSGEGEQGSS